MIVQFYHKEVVNEKRTFRGYLLDATAECGMLKNMDIFGFISALYQDWIGLMSGSASVFFTIMGFLKRPKKLRDYFGKPENLRKAYWIIALLCFFLALVRVWTGEHKIVEQRDEQIKQMQNKEAVKKKIREDLAALIGEGYSIQALCVEGKPHEETYKRFEEWCKKEIAYFRTNLDMSYHYKFEAPRKELILVPINIPKYNVGVWGNVERGKRNLQDIIDEHK